MSRLPISPGRISIACILVSLTTLLPFFITAQNVGVNTSSPLAGLHVLSDNGLLLQGEHGQGLLPVTGYGSRLVWSSKSSALRFGRITDANGGIYASWWDFANIGDYSFAGGLNTRASGFASFSMGNQNQAIADYSFAAGGTDNSAEGKYSFASGISSTAYSYGEFVAGLYPTVYVPQGVNGYVSADRVFVVGNGQGTGQRSNALTILKNGNTGVGTDAPSERLHVSGNVMIDQANLVFGNTGGSVLIGAGAGNADDFTANHNIFVGENAGAETTTGSNNVALGFLSLTSNISGTRNIAIGVSSLSNNSASQNIAIGFRALKENSSGSSNTSIGDHSMFFNDTGSENIALGEKALYSNESGSDNVAIGFEAGLFATGDNNTFIGNSAGYSNTGSGNVFFGHNAGYDETGNNKLYIDNTNTSAPLIYGDFTSNKVIINDSLQSTAFRMTGGAADGYLLQSDVAGNASWIAPSQVFSDDWESSGDDLYNNNPANVGIGIAAPLDKLHVKGTMRVDSGRINFINTGLSVFIGANAGLSDDLTTNRNVFIGNEAGLNNTSGENIVAIGASAVASNTTGTNNIGIGRSALTNANTGGSNIAIGTFALDDVTTAFGNVGVGFEALSSLGTSHSNTAIGHKALRSATGFSNTAVGYEAGLFATGTGNLFLGSQAGRNETGSNKLYIDNSNTSSPLIYGDFSTNKVTINDSLQSRYLTVSQGAASGHLLVSNDASGNAVWTPPSAIFSDDWSSVDDDLYNLNSGNVGIGTSTPQSKLHLAGDFTLDGGRISTLNTGGSVLIGGGAGQNDELDDNANVFIGENSGHANTSGVNNVAIGKSALTANIGGNWNVAIGPNALSSNTGGSGNIAVGAFSMLLRQSGVSNIALGSNSLEMNASGNNNIALGFFTGAQTTGDENTMIGHEAGFNTLGSGNVFLGYRAGHGETGSNKLYIANSDTGTPLIYGDFTAKKIIISDTLQSKFLRMTQGAVNGYILKTDANGKATWTNPSTLLNGMWALNTLDEMYNTNIGMNVGIGIANPNSKLHVAGNVLVDGGRIGMQNTGRSVFLGENAGATDDLSDNNSVFIGYNAGQGNTVGTNNIAIGAYALDEASAANYNTAIGEAVLGQAGATGSYNTGIGNFSLASITSGGDNLGIGQNAGGQLTHGIRNIALGNYALDAMTDGTANTVIGHEALGENLHGSNNTVMGHYAGSQIQGSNNVIIGTEAGQGATGSGNVFLGMGAGSNETGDHKLYIENSASTTPLIYGDFNANEVTINDSLTVNKELGVGTSSPTSTFEVNGSVAAKFMTTLVAGTTHPDESAMVWRYNTGTGTITLPSAASCPNRMYVIINQTGTPRTITAYRDLTTTNQTTINSSVALWIMSDGSEWWQIK